MQLRTSQPCPRLKMRFQLATTSTRHVPVYISAYFESSAITVSHHAPARREGGSKGIVNGDPSLFSLPSVFTLFRPEYDAIFLSMEEHYSPPRKPLPSSTSSTTSFSFYEVSFGHSCPVSVAKPL